MLYIMMQRTQIYFPEELHQDLKIAAKMANVSLSEYIRMILEEKTYSKPFKEIKPKKKNRGLLILADNAVPFGKKDIAKNFDKYLEESLK